MSSHTLLLVILSLPFFLAGCSSGSALASAATVAPLPTFTQAALGFTPEAIAPSLSQTASFPSTATQPRSASTPDAAAPTPFPPVETALPTARLTSTTPEGGLALEDWRSLPVIPTLSSRARSIYLSGLGQGNNEHAFSKVGDCESQAVWYLTDFDRGPEAYSLGPYDYLQPAIDYYKGSFARSSMAAKSSFNAASLVNPLWSDHSACQPDESPLNCELRIWRPSLALVMLGTNDFPRPATFENNLRLVLDDLIGRGVLPVLATKADNLEGDGSINATIARLAAEYDLPLWNYWRAMQPLPRHGLQEDGAHLTLGPNRFGDPGALLSGWTMRNLTALQVLDVVWRGVTER